MYASIERNADAILKVGILAQAKAAMVAMIEDGAYDYYIDSDFDFDIDIRWAVATCGNDRATRDNASIWARNRCFLKRFSDGNRTSDLLVLRKRHVLVPK